MRFLTGLAAIALIGLVALAADTKFPLTGGDTTVEFTGTKKDGKHDGGFKKLAGTATVSDAIIAPSGFKRSAASLSSTTLR